MLKTLVIVNLCASGAHFLHNAVFLDSYPGPLWIPGAWFVVVVWLLVAGALVRGYLWHTQGRSKRATLAIGAYCASCILVFGHYLYGSPRDFDLLTNVLIVSEGAAGTALLLYFLGWVRSGAAGSVQRG